MFKGAFVALITPHRADGSVDEAKVRELIEFHIKNGTNGIVPCGTTGEAATLTHPEQERMIGVVVEAVNGRVPVIAGAGSNSTREARSLVSAAKKAGADGALLITPYYNKPTQEGLYRHYEAVASKVDIPIVVYNVPGRTGISIEPETVARVAKMDNIVAIKEASGSLEQVTRILSLCDITVISGDDGLTFPMMALGAKGVISVVGNIAPKEMSILVESCLKGDYESARKMHFKLFPLFKNMFIETNPIPVKTALGYMKLLEPHWRLPLCPMQKENEHKLKAVLKEAGLI